MGRQTWIAFLIVLALASAGCITAPSPDGQRSAAGSAETSSGSNCPGSSAPTGGGAQQSPGSQSSVSNRPGSFSFSGQMSGHTKTESYAWENPSSGASISWSGQSSMGSVTLVLLDACGKEVYRKAMSGTSQGGSRESSERGDAGAWTVRLEFKAYTGQTALNINAA